MWNIQQVVIKIVLLLLIAINSIVCSDSFLRRKSLSKNKILGYGLIEIGIIGVYMCYNNPRIFPIFTTLIAGTIICLFFEGSIAQKLLCNVIIADVMYTCNLWHGFLLKDICAIYEYEFWLATWGMSTIVNILLNQGFRSLPIYQKRKYEKFTLKQIYIVSGIGIGYFVIMRSIQQLTDRQMMAQSFSALLVFYIIFIVGFRFILTSKHHMMLSYEQELGKLQKIFFKKHLATYVQINKIKRVQEQFEEETNESISQLLKNMDYKKIEEFKSIITKIEARREKGNPYIITGNSMLDLLINEKYDRACKNNIQMKVNISLPERVGMGTVELCMLLDNTLEYALEQCEHIKEEREKSISIEGVWYKGYIMFKVYYSTPEEESKKVQKNSSEYLIKRAVAKDPYGLGAIVKNVRKHEGEMSLQACGWGEKKLTFSLNAA